MKDSEDFYSERRVRERLHESWQATCIWCAIIFAAGAAVASGQWRIW